MPCNSRRRFLQDGGCFALTIGALGLGGADIFALPMGEVSGAGEGNERRYPVPPADGVDIDRKASVIVARFNGHMAAFALSCPHQNAAVKWVAKKQIFQCTKHDSEYRPDGVHFAGRATRNLDRFPVHLDNGMLVVDMSRVFHSDADTAAWAAATVAV